jgi:hypothetical protein
MIESLLKLTAISYATAIKATIVSHAPSLVDEVLKLSLMHRR